MSDLTTISVSIFNNAALKLTQALKNNDIDRFFKIFEVFFASIPYTIQIPQEKYYQSIFYVIVNLIGAYVQAEVATNEGRIDAIIETQSHIYIFEFKLDQSSPKVTLDTSSAKKALEQIKEIGASFSLSKRNIDKWLIEKIS